jgi:hypothetical protein
MASTELKRNIAAISTSIAVLAVASRGDDGVERMNAPIRSIRKAGPLVQPHRRDVAPASSFALRPLLGAFPGLRRRLPDSTRKAR